MEAHRLFGIGDKVKYCLQKTYVVSRISRGGECARS